MFNIVELMQAVDAHCITAGSEKLGTDLYNDAFKLIKTIKYKHNCGYFFSSGEDTWHGLELKEIKKERRCIQINYVTFNTEWPVNK